MSYVKYESQYQKIKSTALGKFPQKENIFN
jgi:hypothetical protein